VKRTLATLILVSLASTAVASPNPIHEAVYSLVLPGAGQLRMGTHGKAYVFIAAEALSWMSFLGFNFYGHSIETDARIFGHLNAGADFGRDDEGYWSAVELNFTRETYLEDLRRIARSLYPGDPEAQQTYVDDRAVQGEWNWTSKSEWFEFQDMRKSARVVLSRADLILGVIALNHVASAVDAFLTARGMKTGVLRDVSLDVALDPLGDLRLGLVKSF
jgi:hypothetical protein